MSSTLLQRPTVTWCSTGTNLPAFLIGRDIVVTVCMLFIVAQMTASTVSIKVGVDVNLFIVSDGI